ncbi:hypothetical protein J3459_007780 [Metarhizium acridum]|nr:hypothetical protein J3459_007780 [Metarhizium acridum]
MIKRMAKRQLAALTALARHNAPLCPARASRWTILPSSYRFTPAKHLFDQDWNIQTIIDLEWAHTVPLEMQLPPYWLSSSRISVDSFEDQAAITDYEAVLEEYWAIYEAEERKRNGTVVQVPLQRDMWARGSFGTFMPSGYQRACTRCSIGISSRYLTRSIPKSKYSIMSFIGIGD